MTSPSSTDATSGTPPPVPMVFANGFTFDKNGGPSPRGAELNARIDDYISEHSAFIGNGGSFDFLKVTPNDAKYVGQDMVFRLTLPDGEVVESAETLKFVQQETQFGLELHFDVAVGGAPGDGDGDSGGGTDPTPTPPVPPMSFANGMALTREQSPMPEGSVLTGRIDDYTTEDSETIEADGTFDFLKVTPNEQKYVGRTLTFHIKVPNGESIQSDESFAFTPQKVEFGAKLHFNTQGAPPTPPPPPPPPPPKKGILGMLIDLIKSILRAIGIGR